MSLGLDVKTTVEKEPHSIVYNDEPTEHIWPMYFYNAQNTGRSPYNTVNNPGFNKWWFKIKLFIEGSGAIDKDGIIYIGGWNNNFYALYPNGTVKWTFDIGGNVESGPAIDENGVIYVGTVSRNDGDIFYALYPNGTRKWHYKTHEWVYGSPIIGNDNTIYFSTAGGYPWYGKVYALYLNGTLKWSFKTDYIRANPTQGLDGTIYCGNYNGKLFALYPNNGTIKWSFKTGGEVTEGATIADDGTIYFCSWDGYTRALYPNSTLKWKSSAFGRTPPIIGKDGTIYVGSDKLSAINPDDGSVIWQYDVPDSVRVGLCISSDDIIYCSTMDPGYLLAINSDGTERWRNKIGTCRFAPIIGDDGTVYVGTSRQEEIRPGSFISVGYLYAFNEMESNAPSAPEINGPTNGNSRANINYTFKSTSPLGNDVYYYIDWRDGDWNKDWWLGPHESGEEAVISHTWSEPGTYTIRTRCKDTDNLWSDWSEFKVNIKPRTRTWLRFLDMFPILQRLLSFIK